MRYRFRDTYLDGDPHVAGNVFSPKDKRELRPGDPVQYHHAKKLTAQRFEAVVEAVEWPYLIRLKSVGFKL